MPWWQSADVVFDELSSDDVLVGLPVPAVVLLRPVPDGLHLGKLGKPVQGSLTSRASLQDESPVLLAKGCEGHRECLTCRNSW